MEVSEQPAATEPSSPGFLAFYDGALSQVYGYLIARCPGASVAEELTAETFLAAVDASRRENPPVINMPWIIGVARHKLVDHWRRSARETSRLRVLADQYEGEDHEDPLDSRLDVFRRKRLCPSSRRTTGWCSRSGIWTTSRCPRLPQGSDARFMQPKLFSPERGRAFRHAYDEREGPDEDDPDV